MVQTDTRRNYFLAFIGWDCFHGRTYCQTDFHTFDFIMTFCNGFSLKNTAAN
jgi:hypothetical protein